MTRWKADCRENFSWFQSTWRHRANAKDDQGHKDSVVALVAFCSESKGKICQTLSPFGNQTKFWQWHTTQLPKSHFPSLREALSLVRGLNSQNSQTKGDVRDIACCPVLILKKSLLLLKRSVQHLTAINGTRRHLLCANGFQNPWWLN